MSQQQSTNPLHSVVTDSVAHILEETRASFLISTYEANNLVLVRSDGKGVNTHFLNFQRPMGVAANSERIAVGTTSCISLLKNVPAAADKKKSSIPHDACFVPQEIKVTGDIDIHEMAFADDGLWFINTRFSCLCTADSAHSFTPRWHPPFISGYDMQDRCHLNGLGLRDRRPHYATALGQTDTSFGWKEGKAAGGVLMDITTDTLLLQGLSMPHSPRWYRNTLWYLESGHGALCCYDLERKEQRTICRLPGFTRGLDFLGNLAFIGLSKVRESATFSDIPLTRTVAERVCGVWIVDITSGRTVGFLRFDAAVQEIFAVTILHGLKYPELVAWDDPLMHSTYILPDKALSYVSRTATETRNPQEYFEQANIAYQQQKKEEALRLFNQALEIDKGFLPARLNLGITLGDLGRYDEAETEIRTVIAAEAHSPEAIHSLGFLYNQRDDARRAIEYYEEALKLKPDYTLAHVNLGMTLLKLEEYPRGWKEYEYRPRPAFLAQTLNTRPEWNGDPLPDSETLLVYTEMDDSDAILFLRFLPLAHNRARKIIMACTSKLASLFRQRLEVGEIVQIEDIVRHDFAAHISMSSLPHLLGVTMKELVELSHAYLTGNISLMPLTIANSQNLRVGLALPFGSASASLSQHIRTLLDLEGVDFYNLWRHSTGELQDLQDQNIHDVSQSLDDYAAIASVMSQLDLFIGFDSTIAHLAGAIGLPSWVLLANHLDWRWGMQQHRCAWYPNSKLFKWSGDLDAFFSELKNELRKLLTEQVPS